MHSELKILSRNRLTVGEGPLWDDRNQILYTIDVRGQSIQRINPTTGEETKIALPQMVGSIALTESGDLLAALEDGIYLVAKDGGLSMLHDPQPITGQFNDGKVGPDGAFYVGTMDDDGNGAFYRLSPDGTLTKLFEPVTCSNGLAWSSDSKKLYYCDTATNLLEVFDFDSKTGTLSNRSTVCHMPIADGGFDGMTIDQSDHLWVGVWDGSCILEVDPAQKAIVGKIDLPVSRGTCCTFAGDNLDWMAITSAAKERDLSKEPCAGYTFRIHMDVPGSVTNRFAR